MLVLHDSKDSMPLEQGCMLVSIDCPTIILGQELAWEAMAFINEIHGQLQIVVLASYLCRIVQPDITPASTGVAQQLPGPGSCTATSAKSIHCTNLKYKGSSAAWV